MIDFTGVGRNTVVDGFTIQNLPKQGDHMPGHAHAINVRDASPVIMNCCVRINGSTGIGSHVVNAEQERRIAQRDFRGANVKHRSEAVIYHNIVGDNLRLGMREKSSPGLGAKQGVASRSRNKALCYYRAFGLF